MTQPVKIELWQTNKAWMAKAYVYSDPMMRTKELVYHGEYQTTITAALDNALVAIGEQPTLNATKLEGE